MKRAALLVAWGILAAPAFAQGVKRNDGQDWPVLHGDLTRAGFHPKFPAGELKVAWRKELWKELTGTRCEVIVGGGLAFLGTYAGTMYAWDAKTGEEKWAFKAGGPIGHSPSFEGGVLYFGSMDRRLYAVTAATGKELWRFEAGEGFWTSPVVHAGLVMAGARDGVFYAVKAADGKPAWTFRTGDRILQTASVTEDGARVVFGSEDMRVYGLNVRDGKPAWTSRKLAGLSLRDHFPVIAGGLALVTTDPVKNFHAALGEHDALLVGRTGFSGPDKRYIPGTPEDVRKEQDAILEYLKANPHDQTFYALRVEDGKEPWTAPILYTAGLHNPPTPPCVNLKTGEVFVLVRSAYGVWDGGGEVRPYTGVGRLDLKTGRVSLVEHGHKSKDPGRPAGAKDMPWASFNTIGDETQTLSCTPEMLLCNHQGFLGSMRFADGQVRSLYGKRDSYGGFYGPATFGWEDQGGIEKARKAGQPYGIVNEWHGPAKAIVSVAGRFVYYPVGSQVICLEGKD
jgi:outer membrane protein assembly factor BamB